MTPSTPEFAPFADLPPGAVDKIEKLNKAASGLTLGLVVSIFIPAGLLFVVAFGILRIVQSSRLITEYPIISNPMAQFPGRARAEIRILSDKSLNLKRVMEFADARKAFWVATLFPLLYVGGIIAFVMSLK